MLINLEYGCRKIIYCYDESRWIVRSKRIQEHTENKMCWLVLVENQRFCVKDNDDCSQCGAKEMHRILFMRNSDRLSDKYELK